MTNPDFTNKVVVLVNAAHEPGPALARRFAQAGAQLVLTTPDAGAGAFAALSAAGISFAQHTLDPQDVAAPHALVQALVAQYKRIDVWVNLASPETLAAAEDLTPPEWQAALTAISGTCYSCQAVGRQMLAQGGGVIVNLTSVRGRKAIEGHAAATIAAAATMGLTQALGVEWAGRGVRVVGVAAGPLESDSAQTYTARGGAAAPASRIPLQRQGAPGEIADAVLFVASDRARFITAETLAVDGGWSAYQLF